MSLDIKPQSHLINIIESTKDHHPNFVVFLGAGASATSGVKTAGQMIAQWRQKYYEMNNNENLPFDEFYKLKAWHNSDQEYAILFEALYDEPSQRREFIESCLKDASPSWGYIFLVNLLGQNIFNTVFTTNFDDLLNEACYTYSSNIRPIVCAHDSSITSLRITSQRQKIIKLHGDFLFDNLKNTVKELETLEKNMMEKFRQYASEYGFIFVGYSGNDRSIMDSLNLLLKNESNFPHGVYWCIRKGEKPRDKLDVVRRFSKVKLIEIDGFDEFFAELNETLKLELQPEMADPYNALSNRLDGLFEKTKLVYIDEIHPIIRKHIDILGEKITKVTSDAIKQDENSDIKVVNMPIPLGLLATISEMSGKFQEAEKLAMQQLEKSNTLQSYDEALRILYKSNNHQKADEVFNNLMVCKELIINDINSCLNISLNLINNQQYEKAEQILTKAIEYKDSSRKKFLEEYFILNLYQINVHKNQDYCFTPEQITKLEEYEKSNDISVVYGAKILLKKYSEAEEALMKMKERSDISGMKEWPISKLLKPHLKNIDIYDNK